MEQSTFMILNVQEFVIVVVACVFSNDLLAICHQVLDVYGGEEKNVEEKVCLISFLRFIHYNSALLGR